MTLFIDTVGPGPDHNAGHCPECGERAAIVDTPTHIFFACRRCQVKWLYEMASYKGELSRDELVANDARMQSYRTVEQPNIETPFQ